jgi:hypothetical protein
MDQTKEKKWYLYISDHHEGPFSVQDILNKVALAQITHDHYVWAEGMEDWKKIKEVGDFQNFDPSKKTGTHTDLNALVNKRSETKSGWTPTKNYKEQQNKEPSKLNIESPSKKWQRDLEAGPVQSFEVDMSRVKAVDAKREKIRYPLDMKYEDEITKKTRRPIRLFKKKYVFFTLLGVAIYFRGTVSNYIPKDTLKPVIEALANQTRGIALKAAYVIPSIKTWVSPIPNLEGVTSEEMAALNEAASSNPKVVGGKIEIAMNSTNVDSPRFYVGSNMPDGTVIDIYVQGEPDSLLNAWQFNSKLTAKLAGNWAEFEALKTPAGQPIPRGYYKIYATESKTQDPEISKLLMTLPAQANQGVGSAAFQVRLFKQGRYFLGGKKDNTYAQRLKDFHEKLGIKARAELSELRGFIETLESQFHSTVLGFAQVQKGKLSTKKIKAWEDFHGRWTKLTDHLNGTFSKWDLNRFKTEKFHAEYYKGIVDLGRAVAAVHEMQFNFFTTTDDKRLYDAQLQQKVDETKALVLQLKMKISQGEKMPLKMRLEAGNK